MDSLKRQRGSRYFSARIWTATLIVTSVLGGILLLWLASKVFLLFFAASLFGIFLRAIADLIKSFTHWSRDWSLAAAILLLLCLFSGLGWLLAPSVSKEVQQVSNELPQAIQKLEAQLRQYSWGNTVVDKLENPSGLIAQTGGIMKKAQALFSISLEGVIDVLAILFCGFYLAARPEVYVDGVLRLIPPDRRDRASTILKQIGQELRHWLLGQIVSMTVIGILTWVGLLVLRIPASGVLGILAGILDFVPVAGPWVAGIISCILALLRSPMRAVFVACLFVCLHLLEGHLVMPLIQRKATQLPPVLTIFAMILFYTLFGFFGLFLAVPLLAFILIAVRSLYVEDLIERQTPPGQDPIVAARK